ncbi:hypothetical protein BDW71DRAFT_21242 [Aspergillus fruticulosus]
MHVSKSYTLLALALAAGTASAHASEELKAAAESTAIEAPVATSAPAKEATTTAAPLKEVTSAGGHKPHEASSAVTSAQSEEVTTYVSETYTTWVTTTTTVCDRSICHEKHHSTPMVVPSPHFSTITTTTQPSVLPITQPSVQATTQLIRQPNTQPSAQPSNSAFIQSGAHVPESSAPVPSGVSRGPSASSMPLINPTLTPAASKTTLNPLPSSSAHKSKTSTQHKPTLTSSHGDNNEYEEEGAPSGPKSTDTPINPGSRLIIPSLASLTGAAFGLFYLA